MVQVLKKKLPWGSLASAGLHVFWALRDSCTGNVLNTDLAHVQSTLPE